MTFQIQTLPSFRIVLEFLFDEDFGAYYFLPYDVATCSCPLGNNKINDAR
jgi:hypothetical protein